MESFYHFTTVDTLVSMLDNSLKFDENTNQRYIEFWATAITALNDTTERDLFVNSLINQVRQYANRQQINLTNEQEKELGKLCYSDLYVISLTSKELSISDELNMWRGYGGNGYGACLELDFSNVPPFYSTGKNTFQMEDVFRPRKCNYTNAANIEIDDDIVTQLYEVLASTEEDYTNKTLAKSAIMSKIANIAPYYKHEAYKSEHEWRFVKHSLAEPKYRKRGNLIIPYITYNIPVTSIISIKIGPCVKNSEDIDSLVQFIRRRLGTNVQIKFSEIPYRG